MNEEFFKQAELSLAAYANLIMGVDIKDELKISGLSDLQADKFISKYLLVDQYNDPIFGLSATVFIDKDSKKSLLAIRGTEEDDLRDLLTDLVNITWLGDTLLQPQYISLKFKVVEWIENGVLPQSFTVTSHSLGGFLAAGLVAEPLIANHISHAYLFNAPGVGGFTGSHAAAHAVLNFLGASASTYDHKLRSAIS